MEGERGAVGTAWKPKGVTLSLDLPKIVAGQLLELLQGTTWVRGDGAATATLDLAEFRSFLREAWPRSSMRKPSSARTRPGSGPVCRSFSVVVPPIGGAGHEL